MSKKKKIEKMLMVLVVIILGISATFVIGLQIKLKGFNKEVSKIKIHDVDLSMVKDGIYIG